MYKKLLILIILFSHIFSISASTAPLIVSEKTAAKIAETCDKERTENLKKMFIAIQKESITSDEKTNKIEAALEEQKATFKQCVTEKLEAKSREEHYTPWYMNGLAGLGCITAVLIVLAAQGPNGKGM